MMLRARSLKWQAVLNLVPMLSTFLSSVQEVGVLLAAEAVIERNILNANIVLEMKNC